MAKLSDVAAINPARKVKKGQLVPFVEMAALPLSGRDISASDLATRVAKGAGAHFQNGDTLLARITPCLENGKTAQVNLLADGVVGEGSTEFIVLCGHEPADNDFVYYLCREPEFRKFAISRMEGTSGRQRVSWQSIAGYPIELPPPEVRRGAADFLATLDDRIENLRQTSATLEAIAAAVFKSWFVDLDGVDDQRRKYTFGEIATLVKRSVNPSAQPKALFLHYSLPAFDAGQMPIAEAGEAIKSNKTSVPSGSVLVSKLNPHIPRVWFVGDVGENAVCSTEFLVWVPKPGIGSAFVYFVAKSPDFNAAMRQLVTGTSNSHQRVRPEQLAQVQAAVASELSISRFDAVAAPLIKRIEYNRQQGAILAGLRDALLSRLISGQLRVPQ